MFGPRFRSLFTSRWMALMWAVWICLLAAQFAGGRKSGGGTDASSEVPSDNADIAAAAKALGG